MSLEDLLKMEENSFVGLLAFILIYMFGFGLRYLLTGKKDHSILNSFLNIFRKNK